MRIVALAAALSVQVAGSRAQSMEDLLVTGAYAPLPQLTAATSVLDHEQIRALNKRSLAEVLQTVPGLLVERQGGPGGLTAVSIRGAESNFTLVLLDGVPVNDPTNTRGGSFDFSNLNPALVERIEIVRGAQSAVYGSDALAGVINVISRRPAGAQAAQLVAEWGEDDYANYSATAQGRRGDWDYALGYAYRDDGEPVAGSRSRNDNADLRLGWQAAEGHRLEFAYRYLDGERSAYPEQSGGPVLALTDDLDTGEYRDEVVALSWRARLGEVWSSHLSLDRFSHEDEAFSPGIPPYLEVPPNRAETEFERDQVRWVNTLSLAAHTELNLGADHRAEDGRSEGYVAYFGQQVPTDFTLDRATRGYFANVSSTAIDGLLLQGSLRYDDPDRFDGETSLSLGARYSLGQAWSLGANWGEAFKLPSFFALGHPLVGNPDLEPETATSWDLGLAWESDDLRVAVTGFFNDYRDLVDFDDESFRNVNRSEVETRGVELESRWQVSAALRLQGQLSYTDIDVKGQDTVLTGRPEWVAALSGGWQISRDWQTTLDYRYTGKQWATSRHTGMAVSEELDDFHRLDWVLRWAPAPDWSLSLSADNLLDEDYQTAVGFPAPGRSLRLGIGYGL